MRVLSHNNKPFDQEMALLSEQFIPFHTVLKLSLISKRMSYAYIYIYIYICIVRFVVLSIGVVVMLFIYMWYIHYI